MSGGTIGNHSEYYRSDEDVPAPLRDRILACLATWVTPEGVVVEPTTGELAARLRIAPNSMERDQLNADLRLLKSRRLIAYEMRPDIEWRLTRDGWGIARTIATGVSGWGRSARGDRDRDRFSQVRNGTVNPLKKGR